MNLKKIDLKNIITTNKNIVEIIIMISSSIFFLIFSSVLETSINLVFILYIINILIVSTIIYFKSNNELLKPTISFYLVLLFFVVLSPVFHYLSNGAFNIKQLQIFSFSMVCYSTGMCFFNLIQKKRDVHVELKPEKNESLKFISYILCFISMIGYIMYFFINRNFLFGGDLENGRIQALSGNGIIIQMMNLSTIGLCFLFEDYLKRNISFKKFIVLFLTFSMLAMIRGFRSAIISPFFIILIMYNKYNKISNKWIIRIGIIIIIAIVLLGGLRNILSSQNANIFNSIISIFRNGSINFNYIYNAFGNRVPFQYGYTYLINILMLKPGPDLDFTLWLKEILDVKFNGGGITPTIIGELYINFGTIGTYIGMFLIGVFVAWLDRFYNSSQHLFYSSFIVYTVIISTTGGIANTEISLLINTIVYFFVYYFVIKKGILKNDKGESVFLNNNTGL